MPTPYFGPSTRSGTTGLTSNTAFKRSSITLPSPFFPASLISSSFFSASLLASSSAFLLPLVCYIQHVSNSPHGCLYPTSISYLGLKLSELIFLFLSIRIDFLLCLVSGLLYTLRAIWFLHQSLLFRGLNIGVDIYSHSLAIHKEVSAP
jgi:hypothetical protein